MKVYNLDNDLNNVDYNIELLEYSNLENNLYFIAGHSGGGDNCYFNNIKNLGIGEYVYLVNKDSLLVYRIISKYYIFKSGYMEVNDNSKKEVYLITCDVNNNNRQLILKGILVNDV
jgi:LPXTG-site transpeptidase (sortase) family protein